MDQQPVDTTLKSDSAPMQSDETLAFIFSFMLLGAWVLGLIFIVTADGTGGDETYFYGFSAIFLFIGAFLCSFVFIPINYIIGARCKESAEEARKRRGRQIHALQIPAFILPIIVVLLMTSS